MKHLKPNSWCAIPGCPCGGKPQDDSYNGWTNYETWNVALWIENDAGLYSMAKEYKRQGYKVFTEALKELGGEISLQTPDGVAWNDSGLDIGALNELLGDL